MKLIFAQGNPGSQYETTRHNTGFLLLDKYAHNHGARFLNRSKFAADVAEASVNGEKVLLAKPTTFYNETGRALKALVDFYKLDPSEDIIVIHDELALPLGTVRTRSEGSDAGNNGIKSLNASVGTAYKRVRVGIWGDKRNVMNDVDFVIGRFSGEELDIINDIYPLVEQKLDAFIAGTHADETIKLPISE